MKRPCWLIGHKDGGVRECGWAICECGIHEYYDHEKFYKPGLLQIPAQFIVKQRDNFSWWFYQNFRKCSDCEKLDTLFGKDVGDHKNCIPF